MSGEPFGGGYAGRRILVTGHTGFVGSWAVRWLRQLGAEVAGYSRGRSRPPVPPPELTTLAGDIQDPDRTAAVVREYAPQLVLHLAGETLVSRGFAAPAETFRNNLLGAVSVLDAALHCPTTEGVLLLGTPAAGAGPAGPYAASKRAVEAVATGYAHARTQQPVRDRPVQVAVIRPGVMVGGDWAADRLVPDAVRAVRAGQPVPLRQPDAVRPWQHVLDGLSGVLAAGQQILSGTLPRLYYDLGRPEPASAEPAADLVAALLAGLGVPDWPVVAGPGGGDRLVQDCAAATEDLGWRPAWDLPALAAATGRWYQAAGADPAAVAAITDAQIEQFLAAARQRPVPWAV